MAQVTGPDDTDIDADLLYLSINDTQTPAFNELTLIGRVFADKFINFKAIKAIILNA